MTSSVREVDVVHATGANTTRRTDQAAVEEPVEIRVHGAPFVVIMRTPGADRELTAGFLLAERVVHTAGDLLEIGVNERPATPSQANTIEVTLAPAAFARAAAMLAQRRPIAVNSSCGACGQRSIDDLMKGVSTINGNLHIGGELIRSLPERLRAGQRVFEATGGLHAAALFDLNATPVAFAEDVGRHNAVDKVIGARFLAGALPLAKHVLFVSGRTSFEIVQKAVVAGVPVVAAVSAPSSLAIDLAITAGVTLIGFVRGDSFNVYSHAQRVQQGNDA